MKFRVRIERLLMLFLILAIAMGASCAEESKAYPNTIFAQTDSYMAVKVGEQYPFGFYFMYNEAEDFSSLQLERVVLEGADGVTCEFSRFQEAAPCGSYQAMSILTELHFHQAGKYVVEDITLLFGDGSRASYPVGRLVIDIYTEDGNENLYTYETTAMSSKTDSYSWRCYYKNDAVKVEGISMDLLAECKVTLRDTSYENQTREYRSGKEADVTFVSEKPAVYRFVLPKVEVTENGVSSLAYAKVGCYCGGLNITEEEMLRAYEAFQMQD